MTGIRGVQARIEASQLVHKHPFREHICHFLFSFCSEGVNQRPINLFKVHGKKSLGAIGIQKSGGYERHKLNIDLSFEEIFSIDPTSKDSQ